MQPNSKPDLGTTWAALASRGARQKVLQARPSPSGVKEDPRLVGSVLFEDADLKGQVLAAKAKAIIQQALTSGSVLFSFAKGIFTSRFDAYRLIQSQVSSNVEFRPISLYDNRSDGSLLIEALFDDVEDANKAMTSGVTVNGIVYQAYSSGKSKDFGDLKHVQFTLLKIAKDSAFIGRLIESLSYYGHVLQVKQFKCGEFFEGKYSVMLDTSVGYQVGDTGESMEARPLDRMLYLSEFDCFVPATYKGAPPVCHFCKRSGHIRAKCPDLAQRKCFGCNQSGHMIKFCPEAAGKKPSYLKKQKLTHEETEAKAATDKVLDKIENEKIGTNEVSNTVVDDSDLDNEIAIENIEHSSEADTPSDTGIDTTDDHLGKDDIDMSMDSASDVDDDDEVILPATKLDSQAKTTVAKVAYHEGSASSKFAPISIASNMLVDKPSEMMKLSTLQSRTQERMKAFEFKNKKTGSTAPGSSSSNKTGNKRPTTTRSARGAQ